MARGPNFSSTIASTLKRSLLSRPVHPDSVWRLLRATTSRSSSRRTSRVALCSTRCVDSLPSAVLAKRIPFAMRQPPPHPHPTAPYPPRDFLAGRSLAANCVRCVRTHQATDGAVLDYTEFAEKAHAAGAKVACAADLLSLTKLQASIQWVVDAQAVANRHPSQAARPDHRRQLCGVRISA